MRYRESVIALVLIGLLMIVPAGVIAQDKKNITGQWEGSIKLPGAELGIKTKFTRDSSGNFAGTIDIPMQGAVALPLANIRMAGDSVLFDLPDVPGNPAFTGILADDGKKISGNFSQGGGIYPFELAMKDAAEIEKEAQSQEAAFGKLRIYIDSTMRNWKTPGIALAVVKDKKVIFSEGFGLRSVKDSLSVTSKTIFAIGSSTKAFTTMVMGMLADDGKLEWDKPVRNYIPDFKMKDDFASQRMTPRDLVTHRSGLPRHDLVWYNNLISSRKDLVNRLQYLEPNKDFRTDFQYQNLMFLTAGYLIEQITGDSWENNVRNRVFLPLEMNSSNFSVLESMSASDFALPYKDEDSVIKEIPFRNITIMGPAGSINSNLEDMCKWILFQLGDGMVGDSQLISAGMMNQMHTPYMSISVPQKYPDISPASYGLGWFIDTYRGHSRIYHGGNIDGFSALVLLFPNDNMGIVALANLDGTPAPDIVCNYAAEQMLGLEPIDWNTRMKAERDKAKEVKKKEIEKDPDRIPGTKPSHKLADFAGDYENPGYGIIKVKADNDGLQAVYNDIPVKLEHWHYDVFRGIASELEDQKILFTFSANAKGDIDRLTAPLEPLVSEIEFMRKPGSEMRDPKFLSQFVGQYELAGQVSRFELRGDTILTLTVPGQPVYELVPYKGTEFNIKGLSGFSIEFKQEKDGRVNAVVFNQPNGIFTATRKE